ncbi:MAG: acetoacetate--CoA ligase [Burkholderiales bacterium]|nr:acetoacetate--CoA ligase [Burkholderiales bacterium]
MQEGAVLWEPPAAFREATGLARYMRWLAEHEHRSFAAYDALWAWSVRDLEEFWASLWTFFDVRASAPYTRVLSERRMPGARWFEGARLNYAAHVFRNAAPDHPALIACAEARPAAHVSWAELERQVGAVADALREMGVEPGDRVVSYLPNLPETVVAFLACASLGAIWSSCSPDMGTRAVVDRFRQIEPKVLFAVDGYVYGGKAFDRTATVAEIARALPSLEHVVFLQRLGRDAPAGLPHPLAWEALLRRAVPLAFAQLPFDHPLWIVYSSGTTGAPKAIVHGHGGIVLEHLKTLVLHHDMRPGDRFFWLSSTGWIVWNLLVGGLLAGCTIVTFDGNPGHPDPGAIWRTIGETRTRHFGCGAALVAASMKAGVAPRAAADLATLEVLNTTGSPLPIEAFEWAYASVKRDLWLAPISGGTDVACGFVGGCPLLPVTAGEMQCRMLGVAARALDERGREVVGEVGELVITEPMPSMPLYFWNDPGDARYRESYFEMYPGLWRHGDWIRFTERGTNVIYGRSDTTINRHGIRMGTAEIYRAVEDMPEIVDSLVVDLEYLGRPSFMPLFVVLADGAALDDGLKSRIKQRIRTAASARHVPDEIYAIDAVPRTLTGKKMELPVRKILLGAPADRVASADAMANPASLTSFVSLAARLNAR